MLKYYIITCKNDFPPVNEYNICVVSTLTDAPKEVYLKYQYGSNLGQIEILKKDRLVFVCRAKDLIEAVIKFYEKYLCGGFDE